MVKHNKPPITKKTSYKGLARSDNDRAFTNKAIIENMVTMGKIPALPFSLQAAQMLHRPGQHSLAFCVYCFSIQERPDRHINSCRTKRGYPALTEKEFKALVELGKCILKASANMIVNVEEISPPQNEEQYQMGRTFIRYLRQNGGIVTGSWNRPPRAASPTNAQLNQVPSVTASTDQASQTPFSFRAPVSTAMTQTSPLFTSSSHSQQPDQRNFISQDSYSIENDQSGIDVEMLDETDINVSEMSLLDTQMDEMMDFEQTDGYDGQNETDVTSTHFERPHNLDDYVLDAQVTGYQNAGVSQELSQYSSLRIIDEVIAETPAASQQYASQASSVIIVDEIVQETPYSSQNQEPIITDNSHLVNDEDSPVISSARQRLRRISMSSTDQEDMSVMRRKSLHKQKRRNKRLRTIKRRVEHSSSDDNQDGESDQNVPARQHRAVDITENHDAVPRHRLILSINDSHYRGGRSVHPFYLQLPDLDLVVNGQYDREFPEVFTERRMSVEKFPGQSELNMFRDLKDEQHTMIMEFFKHIHRQGPMKNTKNCYTHAVRKFLLICLRSRKRFRNRANYDDYIFSSAIAFTLFDAMREKAVGTSVRESWIKALKRFSLFIDTHLPMEWLNGKRRRHLKALNKVLQEAYVILKRDMGENEEYLETEIPRPGYGAIMSILRHPLVLAKINEIVEQWEATGKMDADQFIFFSGFLMAHFVFGNAQRFECLYKLLLKHIVPLKEKLIEVKLGDGTALWVYIFKNPKNNRVCANKYGTVLGFVVFEKYIYRLLEIYVNIRQKMPNAEEKDSSPFFVRTTGEALVSPQYYVDQFFCQCGLTDYSILCTNVRKHTASKEMVVFLKKTLLSGCSEETATLAGHSRKMRLATYTVTKVLLSATGYDKLREIETIDKNENQDEVKEIDDKVLMNLDARGESEAAWRVNPSNSDDDDNGEQDSDNQFDIPSRATATETEQGISQEAEPSVPNDQHASVRSRRRARARIDMPSPTHIDATPSTVPVGPELDQENYVPQFSLNISQTSCPVYLHATFDDSYQETSHISRLDQTVEEDLATSLNRTQIDDSERTYHDMDSNGLSNIPIALPGKRSSRERRQGEKKDDKSTKKAQDASLTRTKKTRGEMCRGFVKWRRQDSDDSDQYDEPAQIAKLESEAMAENYWRAQTRQAGQTSHSTVHSNANDSRRKHHQDTSSLAQDRTGIQSYDEELALQQALAVSLDEQEDEQLQVALMESQRDQGNVQTDTASSSQIILKILTAPSTASTSNVPENSISALQSSAPEDADQQSSEANNGAYSVANNTIVSSSFNLVGTDLLNWVNKVIADHNGKPIVPYDVISELNTPEGVAELFGRIYSRPIELFEHLRILWCSVIGGLGLYISVDVAAGGVLFVYQGQMGKLANLEKLLTNSNLSADEVKYIMDYRMELNSEVLIEAHMLEFNGTVIFGRYANSSPHKECVNVEKKSFKHEMNGITFSGIVYRAKRDLKAGTQLLYSYGKSYDYGNWGTSCPNEACIYRKETALAPEAFDLHHHTRLPPVIKYHEPSLSLRVNNSGVSGVQNLTFQAIIDVAERLSCRPDQVSLGISSSIVPLSYVIGNCAKSFRYKGNLPQINETDGHPLLNILEAFLQSDLSLVLFVANSPRDRLLRSIRFGRRDTLHMAFGYHFSSGELFAIGTQGDASLLRLAAPLDSLYVTSDGVELLKEFLKKNPRATLKSLLNLLF